MDDRVFGLVLAGGRSSRFGSDKAAAVLAGRTLLTHALERLRASCETAAVSAGSGSPADAIAQALGAPVLHDPSGFPAGPLSGVCAGLAWAEAGGATLLATTPCDLPLAPDDLVARLRAAMGPDDAAAVARSPDGLQPLCMVIRTALHAELARRLEAGEHPAVQAWLREAGVREVAFGDADGFLNINSREDLARAEAMLRRPRPSTGS